MTRISLICPECAAELTLPARRLVVRIDPGIATDGEVLFTCLMCHASAPVPLDADGIAALAVGGASILVLADAQVTHPEDPPAGRPLTHDDLLDLHTALADDAWLGRVAAGDPAEPAGRATNQD